MNQVEKVDPLAAKLPSVKQMLVRAQQGHFTLLRAARECRKIERPRFISELRGFATARATLLQWQAIQTTAEAGVFRITKRGLELLAAHEARAALRPFNGGGQ